MAIVLSPYLGIVPATVFIGRKLSQRSILLGIPVNFILGYVSIKEMMAMREWNGVYKKYLSDKHFEKAIDLGSGTGCYGAYLRKHADKVIAVEKNPLMSFFSKIRFIYDDVVETDIKDFHDYDNAFVLALHVIEHLDKEIAFTTLAEIRAKALAGLIVVPKEPLKSWYQPIIARLFGSEFLHRTKLTELDFKSLGYDVEKVNGSLLAKFGL